MKAYDIMTRSVASVTPGTPISKVAATMRDLNIGDVLVVENGKLKGIVTDRDLAIHALTNGGRTDTPVENYMSTDVVTGAPTWDMSKLAKVMGERQIRRLPIVENDEVVGIVSLGDVAVHSNSRDKVGASLQNISEPTTRMFRDWSPTAKFIGLAIPVVLAAGVMLWATSSDGKRMRRQLEQTDIAGKARETLMDTVKLLQDPKTGKAALEFIQGSGIPDKARDAVDSGVRTLKHSQVRENAMDMAEDMSHQAKRFAHHNLNGKALKKQAKRFAIV